MGIAGLAWRVNFNLNQNRTTAINVEQLLMIIANTTRHQKWSRGVKRYYSILRDSFRHHEIRMMDYSPQVPYKYQRIFELAYRGSRESIIWSPCLRGPLYGYNHVVTVHDCIDIQYIFKNRFRRFIKHATYQKTLDNAVKIIAISDTTRNQILDNYSVGAEKIVVIKSACVGIRIPTLESNGFTIDNLKIGGRPFILMVTNQLPHKNTLRACQALCASLAKVDGISLMVIGSLTPEDYKILEDHNFPFMVVDQISDTALINLYKTCIFFISPSLLEGHNLPISEALSFGQRVLCSDIPVHREFYDGFVSFFDPMNTDSIIIAINNSITTSSSQACKIFSPERTNLDVADEYVKLFNHLAKSVG